VLISAVIGLQLAYNGIATGQVLGRQTYVTISSLLEQTNQRRTSVGLGGLKLNEKLNKAAYLKAQDMLARQYWAHDAPDGTPPWKWLGDVSYQYDEAGENLAKNFSSTDGAMEAWMNSPTHKENILNSDYTEVGFAILDGELQGKSTSLVVALYAKPISVQASGVKSSFINSNINSQTNIFTQFAVAARSFTPAAVVGLLLIALAAFVSTSAHFYRHMLPKMMKKTWKQHHGLYKALGFMIFALVIISMYGGGQI